MWPDPACSVGYQLTPCMSLFLGNNVRHLTLEAPRWQHPTFEGSLRYNTKQFCQSVQSLLIQGGDLQFVTKYLASFSWDSLSSVGLSLEAFDAGTFRYLARLPGLRILELIANDDDFEFRNEQTQPSTRADHFASLRHLRVEFNKPSQVERLLKYLPSTNSVKQLECISWGHTDASECQAAVEAVRQYCNPLSLAHLSVHASEVIPPHGSVPSQEPMDVNAGDGVDMTPLYNFKMLESLTMQSKGGVHLTPDVVDSIVSAWPRMRHLDLCPTYPSFGRIPSIDHTHLLPILRGCPSLDFLGLRFDTTQMAAKEQATGQPSTFRLRTLRVGESPICSPARVVEFLQRHFPVLTKLDRSYDSIPGRSPTMLDKRWASVAEEMGLSGV